MHPNAFEQLRVFREVVAAGGFTAAARSLGKAVSAVSYAIANLEAHFGVALFDRSGHRPELTEAGRTLYQESLIVFRRLERLQARIDGFKEEQEARLVIAHDAYTPAAELAAALSALKREHPHLDVHLAKARSANVVAELEQSDLFVGALFDTISYDGLDGVEVGATDAVFVCAPTHPLAQLEQVELVDLEDHTQLVLIDAPPDPGAETYAVHTTDYWTTNDVGLFVALLLHGGHWAWAFHAQVAEQLNGGELKALKMPAVKTANRRFAVAWSVQRPGGGVVRRFIDLFAKELSTGGGRGDGRRQ